MNKLYKPLILLATLAALMPTSVPADDTGSIRFATFNIAMGLNSEGELYKRLISGEDEALKKVAAVIQQVRPDVLLINEFDMYELDSAALFINRYLGKPQMGGEAISYAHAITGAVNTGEDSGLDLDNNGELGDPGDAWGYGTFPGQYGMAVLSRFPLKLERNLRHFKWRDMPAALAPKNPDGSDWYPDHVFQTLRLSSKSHWDVVISIDDRPLHFLVSHPTPPVFDGPEDRNGARNYDEIRLWADYIDTEKSAYIYDDAGTKGGLQRDALFVIAGDLNADPVDGDSTSGAILQLLKHPLIDASCVPMSDGAAEATVKQAGRNLEHQGNPAADTGDFNDKYTGNMRIDYVLPSSTLNVQACGVFWPASDQPGHKLVDVSDHHLVWLDVTIP